MGLVCEELLDTCLDPPLDSRDNISAVVVAFPAAVAPYSACIGGSAGVRPRQAARAKRRAEAEAREDQAAALATADTVSQVDDTDHDDETDLGRATARLARLAGGGASTSNSATDTSGSRAVVTEAIATPRPPPSSATQLLELRRVFDSLDLDGNGVLDRDEVYSASVQLSRPLIGDSALDSAMAAMDADDDGTVDFAEFAEWWEGGGKLSPSEQLDLKWKSFGQVFDQMASTLL
eukprot:COSAG05_NODE_1191_length_5573_cov_12.076361_3_plen_235_part_00